MTPRECPVVPLMAGICDVPTSKLIQVCQNCPNRAPSHEAELREALESAIETMLDYGASKWRVDKARAALQKAGTP